jgi:RNA polymerase sigma-70 factor (ECF subfamily)
MEGLFCDERAANGYIIGSIVQRHPFDSEYVRRLAERDELIEQHFTSYFGDLLTIKLRSRLRSWHLIDDVKQETFLRVLKSIRDGKLTNPAALGAFVNSVCNNILFEVYGAQSRIADPPDDQESEDVNAETALVDAQQRDIVRTVLAALPAKDREILRLLFFEELDKHEVCRRFKVDREYLRVLLHRAKLRFRAEYLKRKGPPDEGLAIGAGRR